MAERYLIVKPSSLGDVIHAFPAVTRLAKIRQEAKIDWVVVPAFADVVRMHPSVDRVILFPRKELGKVRTFVPAFLKFLKELRKERYTAVLDLQGLLRSALISGFSRSDVIAGPLEPKEKIARLFYGKKVDSGPDSLHAVIRNCRLIASFFKAEPEEKIKSLFLENRDSAARAAEWRKELPPGPVVAIAPGARWKSKCWPAEFFAKTAEIVKEKYGETVFLILGTRDEEEIAEELCKKLHAPCLNLTGKTSITELVELIRISDVLFCNDSGPMHIAAALDVPVVTMFAPTDPVRTGPYSEKAQVLIPEGLPCLKCFRHECPESSCHRSIPPEKAADAISGFLARSRSC